MSSSTAAADTHECPYPGCTRQVRRSMLACRAHWYTVSKATRDLVWDAYTGGTFGEHAKALRQAIGEMEAHHARKAGAQQQLPTDTQGAT